MKKIFPILILVCGLFQPALASDLRNLSEVALLMAYDEMGQECEQRGALDRALFWYTLGMKTQPSFYECRFVRFNIKERKHLEEKLKKRRKPPSKGVTWSRDATPSDSVVYVYAEEGMGDTLHFSRYLRCLVDDGYQVLFRPQRSLATLMEESFGDAITVEVELDEESLPFDCYVPLLSLPHHYLTKVEEIPGGEGYLQSNAQHALEYKDLYFDTDVFKVGIVWQGCPNRFNDEHRSLPLSQLLKLAEIEGVQLYALQCGVGREQLEPGMPLIDLGSVIENFADTAAMVANLDLLVTVDAATAHLSGGMGHPTWILIPALADWRWFREGADTPWYDSVTLFRQQQTGDWDSTLVKLKKRLQKVVGEGRIPLLKNN